MYSRGVKNKVLYYLMLYSVCILLEGQIICVIVSYALFSVYSHRVTNIVLSYFMLDSVCVLVKCQYNVILFDD